jgi:magnesium transporter
LGWFGLLLRLWNELSREVIEMQRTAHALAGILRSLQDGFGKYDVDLDLQCNLRDVLDHVLRIADRVDSFRALLQDALTVNSALVGQRQNEEMRSLTEASLAQNEEVKRICAWAAILFTPTLVGTIYGMYFDHMPELHWQVGYPLAVLLMLATSLILYACSSTGTGSIRVRDVCRVAGSPPPLPSAVQPSVNS